MTGKHTHRWIRREPYRMLHINRGDGLTLCGLKVTAKWVQAQVLQIASWRKCRECEGMVRGWQG